MFEEKVVDLEELEKKEIVELNKNISQVKDLLLEFSAQVVAQGEIIDRIDFNIVETIKHVDKVIFLYHINSIIFSLFLNVIKMFLD